MSREATINVSITPEQLKLIRQRVDSGDYASASELVRDSLRLLFRPAYPNTQRYLRQARRGLASAYKANAARDRKLAREWAQIPPTWPQED